MKALQTMNKTHAKYEAACGIVDVIELFDPHLKGKVAIDGDGFPCPLPCHPDGDRRLVRIFSGKKFDKPRWKCGAGCNGDRLEDTPSWIQKRLLVDFNTARRLWADLAHAPRTDWVGIVERERPNFYKRIGEARYIDEPVSDAEAEELQNNHLAEAESTYFVQAKVDKALKAMKDTLTAANDLSEQQKLVLFEELKKSLERDDAA